MKRYLIWLICFSILRGLAYILITPPWQAPDETTHLQFMELLTQRPLSEIRKIPLHAGDGRYFELERKILESMKKYRAWEYVGLPTPDPLPNCFFNAPFFVGSAPKIYRPPLYYLLGAGFLKFFKSEDLKTKLYAARLYSLILSLGTVIISYFIGYVVFRDERYALMTGAFVSFLPQFMVIGTSVNSDNLVNLLVSAFLLYALFLLRDKKSDFYLIPIPFFLVAVFLSGKTGVIIAPIAILLLFFQMKRLKKPLTILTLSLLTLASSTILIQYIWPGLIVRAYQILEVSFEKAHSGLARDWGFYHVFSVILFESFWFVGGWMAIYWNRWAYAIVGVLSILSLLGFFKDLFDRVTKKEEDLSLSNPILFLMTLMVLLAFGTCLLYYGFVRGVLAQGRYLFPALPAFGVLFILGLKKICTPSISPYFPKAFIILMACLDLYALFGRLAPYYHFK
jgi:4-amino-4-deoxy-L-arabinose transferase-like glycosyltransferase